MSDDQKIKRLGEFGFTDTDGDMRKGLKVWQHHYLTARNDLGFEHDNAVEYARDNFREWWRANVDMTPENHDTTFDDYNNR